MALLPVPTVRVVHSGFLPGGDRWNTGYWLQVSGGSGDWITQTELNDLATILGGMFNSYWSGSGGVRALASAGVSFDQTDIYFYPAGSAVATRAAVATQASPSFGTSTTIHPNADCLVASLRSSRPGGRGRGRMYLPLNGIPMSTNGNYNSTNTTNVVTSTAAHLAAVNAWAGSVGITGIEVIVASWTGGTVEPVTRVEADSIPDTQRRRDNGIAPSVRPSAPV